MALNGLRSEEEQLSTAFVGLFLINPTLYSIFQMDDRQRIPFKSSMSSCRGDAGRELAFVKSTSFL